MTEPAIDLTEAIYSIGDAASDPVQAAAQLEQLAARIRGAGNQLQPDGSPSATSFVAPEALPPDEPAEPRSFTQLNQALPRLVRDLDSAYAQAPTMENHQRQEDARASLDAYVAEFNGALDREAAAQLGETPAPPADLAGLLEEARTAAYGDDPGSLDPYQFADRVNASLAATSAAVERQQDAVREALAEKARARRQHAAKTGR